MTAAISTPPPRTAAVTFRPSAAPAPLAPSDRLLWHHACAVAGGPALLVPGLVEVCERAAAPGTSEQHAQRFACRIRPDSRGRPEVQRIESSVASGRSPSDQFAVEAIRLLDRLAASVTPRVVLHPTNEHRLHRLTRYVGRRRPYVVLAGTRSAPDLDLEFRVWIDRDLGVAHRLLFHGRLQQPTNERLAAASVLGFVRCRSTPDGLWYPATECLRASFWSSDLALPPRGTVERITNYSRHWLTSPV